MNKMNKMRRLILPVLIMSAASCGIAWGAEHPKAEHPKAKDPKAEHPKAIGDIVAVAANVDGLKTLLTAVRTAGLVEMLQGKGPFTLFAPTDEAFAKLPEGTLETLLKPENEEMLAHILTYHVILGRVRAADVKTSKVKAANGLELRVKVAKDGVTVDQASVVKTDIGASNGIIHLIDAVLLPAAPKASPEASRPKDHPGH